MEINWNVVNIIITDWVNASLIFNALQQMALIFVVAFLFCKSSAFKLLVKNIVNKRDWLLLYTIFAGISILGSILANDVAINANHSVWTQVDSRSIGAFLAGLLGGPVLGTAVGFTAGCYRLSLGGPTATAGFLGTTLAGLLAGMVYLLALKNNQATRFN
jgi:two-component system LytT family sensor kinase